MARAAVEWAARVEKGGNEEIRLKDGAWARPVVVGEKAVKVNIGLYPNEKGEIEYEIYSEIGEGEAVVHSEGKVEIGESKGETAIDIKGLQERKWERELSGKECYVAFRGMGIEYGAGHRGLEEVYGGKGEALARIKMPVAVVEKAEEYVLHPSIMDSAFQGVIGLLGGKGESGAMVPFAMDSIEIKGECGQTMWAVLRYGEGGKGKKIDIDVCDEEGRVSVRVKGLTMMAIEGKERNGLLMLESVWKEEAAAGETAVEEYAERVVFLYEPEGVKAEDIEPG